MIPVLIHRFNTCCHATFCLFATSKHIVIRGFRSSFGSCVSLFDGALPSICSSVHRISDKRSIYGLSHNPFSKSFRCHLTSELWSNFWCNSCIHLWLPTPQFRRHLG